MWKNHNKMIDKWYYFALVVFMILLGFLLSKTKRDQKSPVFLIGDFFMRIF